MRTEQKDYEEVYRRVKRCRSDVEAVQKRIGASTTEMERLKGAQEEILRSLKEQGYEGVEDARKDLGTLQEELRALDQDIAQRHETLSREVAVFDEELASAAKGSETS